MVRYTMGGDAKSGTDYAPLAGICTIPAGQTSVILSLVPAQGHGSGKTAVVSLDAGAVGYHVGCPSASLVVIR
jgi:hypothetical protein